MPFSTWEVAPKTKPRHSPADDLSSAKAQYQRDSQDTASSSVESVPESPRRKKNTTHHQRTTQTKKTKKTRKSQPGASSSLEADKSQYRRGGRQENLNNHLNNHNSNNNHHIANNSIPNHNHSPAPPPPAPPTRTTQPVSQPGAFRVFQRGGPQASTRTYLYGNHNDTTDDQNNTNDGPPGSQEGHDLNVQQQQEDEDEAPPVIEAFVQELEPSRRRPPSNNHHHNNNIHHSHMTPTLPVVEGTPIKHPDDDNLFGCTTRRLVGGACLSIGIVLVAAVVVVVLIVTGGDDNGTNTANTTMNTTTTTPTMAPATRAPATMPPTAAPVSSSSILMFPGANVDNYPYMAIHSVQYGFDLADCVDNPENSQNDNIANRPAIDFHCPGDAAIALLRVLGWDANGQAMANNMACTAGTLGEINCTYRDIITMPTQTTVFLVACASNTQGDVKVEVETKQLTAAACANPSRIAHGLSMGHFCEDTPWNSYLVSFKFGTGLQHCSGSQGTVQSSDISLATCGEIDSCSPQQSSCSADLTFAQVDMNTVGCNLFVASEWENTYDSILAETDHMVSMLHESFIIPGYAQQLFAALRG